jgi:hypothetical protein
VTIARSTIYEALANDCATTNKVDESQNNHKQHKTTIQFTRRRMISEAVDVLSPAEPNGDLPLVGVSKKTMQRF